MQSSFVIRATVAAFIVQLLASCSANDCQRTDCDRYDSPASHDRLCRLHTATNIFTGEIENVVQLEWRAGTLESQPCSQNNGHAGEIADFCPGHVGMGMDLLCDFADRETVIYKDGAPLTGGSNVTYSSLQKEHEGLYQCVQSVNGSNEVVGEFNMTVQSEVHIGGEECRSPHCSSFRNEKCCFYRWSPSMTSRPFPFNIYGERSIEPTLTTEWVTGPDIHYPTDLGLRLEQPDANLTRWNLYIGNDFPQHVTEDSTIRVTVRVLASNRINSFSMCLDIQFRSTNILFTDKTLPQETNTTEGGDAVFTCTFGTRRPQLPNQPALRFEFSYDSSQSTTATCLNWTECTSWSPNPLPHSISLSSVALNDSIYTSYRYEVRLTNVATALNGSIFSCSIVSSYDPLTSDGLTQWKRSAELIVAAVDEGTAGTTIETTTEGRVPEDNEQRGSNYLVAIVVPVSIAFLLLLVLSALLVGFLVRSYKKYHWGYNKQSKQVESLKEDFS